MKPQVLGKSAFYTPAGIRLQFFKGRFHDIFKSKFFERNFCSAQYFLSSTFHDKKCVLYLHLVLILKNAEIATSAVFCKNDLI